MIVFPQSYETSVSLGERVVFIEQLTLKGGSVVVVIPLEYVDALCLALKSAEKSARGGGN